MYSIHQQRSIISSQIIQFHNTYFHSSLIQNYLNLVNAVHIYIYYKLLNIKDDSIRL